MIQNTRNKKVAKRITERLAEDKKKSVTALCLIAVMAFMWIRVLTKKAPQDAEAGPVTDQSSTKDAPREEYKVSFVQLPKVAGRNDGIVRDFFDSDGWQHFDGQGRKSDGTEEVSIVSKDGNEEVIRRVAEKLKLEATFVGGVTQAMINGQTRHVGDKMPISEGSDTYECEVIEIRDNAVVIKCGEAEIRLSIKP